MICVAIWKPTKKNYSNDVDYSNEIKKSIAAGDYAGAEKYERLRNEKIDGEGLNYQKTYDYIDVGTELQKAMKSGASADKVNELRVARDNKIRSNNKYSPYFNDEIQKQAARYYYNSKSGVGGNYENRPQYKEKYNTEIDDLVNKILNKREFSYDLENDPNYQAYKEAAIREGRKAMQDVLAEQSMYAGGNNSYAVSAASQAQNNYLSKLNDVVPTLYGDAYSRYLNEIASDKDALSILLSMQDNDYNKYLQEYNIWDNDRARADADYNRYYAEARDRQNDALTERNYAIEAVNMLLQQGQQPNEELLKNAGYENLGDAIAKIAANQSRAIDLGFAAQEQDLLAGNLANEYKKKQINNYGVRRSPGNNSPGDDYPSEDYVDESNQETKINFDMIDMNSVLSLGMGTISAEKLEEMIESGELEAYEQNGKIYVRWANKANLSGGF